jgi:protein O-mannosyl-transferase
MQNSTEKAYSIKKLLPLILLCCLGIAIYSNSLNGTFHFDDDSSIVGNTNITNLSNITLIWNFTPTRFITYLSFAFNYHLHQLNVFGYHLFNLIIHLSTAILVWWFTLLTFATPAIKNIRIANRAKLIAFFTAAVFIAHPIQTEAITYIVQRTTSLAALFYILTLCLYIKSRTLEMEKTGPSKNCTLYYSISLITALAGMFTKETNITLPFAIMIYEFCFLSTKTKFNWKRILPFLLIFLTIPLTLFLTNVPNSKGMVAILKYSPDISRWKYILTQPRVMITYLRLLFIPLNQNLDYDYPITQTLLEPAALISFLFLLVILTTAIRIFHKYRLISFTIFWFFLTLLPESIIPLPDVIFEHRLYLPMLGYSIFLVAGIYYLLKNRRLGIIILILITTGYAILTYCRNFAWQDDLRLGEDMARKAPGKARSYAYLSYAYSQYKMHDQAIAILLKAIRLYPGFSEAYYNLGGVYYEKNDSDKAIFYLNKAIELNPLDSQAYYYRGMSWGDKKEYAQAVADFKQDIYLSPGHIEGYQALINTYYFMRRYEEAIATCNQAIANNPDCVLAYVYAAEFCEQIGRRQMAIDLCRIALKIDPHSFAAYLQLGVAYASLENFPEAIEAYKKALDLNPNAGLAHNLISWAYYKTKNYDLAKKHSNQAIRMGYPINPKFLEALKNTDKKRP